MEQISSLLFDQSSALSRNKEARRLSTCSERSMKAPVKQTKKSDWRRGIKYDFRCTLIILVVHCLFMIWGHFFHPQSSSFWENYGFRILGAATDCNSLEHLRTGLSLMFNILAAALPMFSSNTLLALASPTRSQLNQCHASGQYMDIGTYSFGNIKKPFIPWRQKIIWGSLVLLAIPFHVLYNGLTIYSIPASESYQVMVSESFFGANYNLKVPNINTANDTVGIDSSSETSIETVSTSRITNSASVTISVTSRAHSTAIESATAEPSNLALRKIELAVGTPSVETMDGVASNCNVWGIPLEAFSCDDFAAEIAKIEIGFKVADLLSLNLGLDAGHGSCRSNLAPQKAYCISTFSSSFSQARRRTSLETRGQSNFLLARQSQSQFSGFSNVDMPLDNTTSFDLWSNAYAMSPYLAFSTTNQSNWNGVSNLTNDLKDLLLLTNITTPSFTWDGVSVISDDWSKIDLDTCLQSFENRYRANTGTLVMVVHQPNISATQLDDKILAIAYVSYRFGDLALMCPTSFLKGVKGGDRVIKAENAPVLPLTFGTFRDKSFYNRGFLLPALDLKWNWDISQLCPQWYPTIPEYAPAIESIPRVVGCLSHTRGSVCRIGYNVVFFTIIVICLALRLILIQAALVVLKNDHPRILTIGDAIAEFLEDEDLSTKGCSLSWSPSLGWHCVRGPLVAYPRGHFTQKSKRRRCAPLTRFLQKFSGNMDELSGDVPKRNTISFVQTMKFFDREIWLFLYLCTVGVVAAINGSVAQQNGWKVLPEDNEDLYWMLWPTFLLNLPQIFASIRAMYDACILTTRISIREFTRHAQCAEGLRVSRHVPGTAQKDKYLLGGMPFGLLVLLHSLQAFYSFILGQLAVPQWINPLRPGDPPEYFSAAFILRLGGQQSKSTITIVVAIVFVIVFPFLGVYIIHCVCSLIEETRDMSVWQLEEFVPQYLSEKLIPWTQCRMRKRKEWQTTSLIPRVPLQMPGPATNSLVLSLACHPRPEEVGTGMSTKRLKWGVVQNPEKLSNIQQPQGVGISCPEPITARQPKAENHTSAGASIGHIEDSSTLLATKNYKETSNYEVFSPWSMTVGQVVPHQSNSSDIGQDFAQPLLYRPVSTDYVIEVPPDEEQIFYPFSHSEAIYSTRQSRSGAVQDRIAARFLHTSPREYSKTQPATMLDGRKITGNRNFSGNERESVTVSVLPVVSTLAGNFVAGSPISLSEMDARLLEDSCGHCSLTALAVSDLQPGMAYTGIRRDDYRFQARGRAAMLVAEVVSSITFKPDRTWIMRSVFGRALLRLGFPTENRSKLKRKKNIRYS